MLRGASADARQELGTRLEGLSGDAGTYLVGHGLPDAHLAGLRAALVEGPAV